MRSLLCAGALLAVCLIAVGCNPDRGKVASNDSGKTTPAANNNAAAQAPKAPKAPAGLEEYKDFEVNIPSAFDGDYNPEGLTVGPEVGDLAPEIEGVDLDGNEFKLSDYRGKVVMLDFYGDW